MYYRSDYEEHYQDRIEDWLEEPDEQPDKQSVALSAYDRFQLARLRMHESVINLCLASIGHRNYSQALDQVAQASANETEAWEDLRQVF
jgi:hypothetical protein